HLRDGRRPPPDGRRARAEVLAQPLRAARALGSRRPGVRAGAARARRALPEPDARCLASAARGQGHVRGTGADSRRSGGGARLSPLTALAFALAGLHVGAHRILPVGYAPAWSPDGARIAYVTRGDLWVADADGTHRSELVEKADQPAWSPNG